jgi:hypothetical protein
VSKDGTNRGGLRIGSGQKKKPLNQKLLEGNPGKRPLKIIEFENVAELKGREMPKPREFLAEIQQDGKTLGADEIYKTTWEWLNERGCAHLVLPQLIEYYSVQAARWIQCEKIITKYGFLAKHPTTGNALQSPYINMSHEFMNQTNKLWLEIYQVVRENCAKDYGGKNPQDDVMQHLLTARRVT